MGGCSMVVLGRLVLLDGPYDLPPEASGTVVYPPANAGSSSSICERPPLTILEPREELRRRLNQVPGVDLPASKIELRPGFDLDVIAEASGRERLLAQLVISWTTMYSRQSRVLLGEFEVEPDVTGLAVARAPLGLHASDAPAWTPSR